MLFHKLLTKRQIKSFIIHTFKWLLFAGMIYVLLYPLLYIMSTSFKTFEDMTNPTTIWIPKNFTFNNYITSFEAIKFVAALRNSLVLSIITMLFQLLSCAAIGYGFARFKFKEKNIIFLLVLFVMIVPPQTIIVPLFMMFQNFDPFGILSLFGMNKINLHNTYFPFILPAMFGAGLKGGFFIYIFRQFFTNIPGELEEAAYIDGCGIFKTFYKVMLPNAKPAILTVSIFSFIWHWNDIFEPTMYISSEKMYTLPMKLVNIIGYLVKSSETVNTMEVLPPKYAGVALVILPALLFYIVGQRYFTESVERSGIVG